MFHNHVKPFLLFFSLTAVVFFSCKKEESEEKPSVKYYDIEYSFVGNDTVAHFYKGVASYLDLDDNIVRQESFDTLPWKKTFSSLSVRGKLKISLAYRNNSDTLNYNNWIFRDTIDNQIYKTIALNPSTHIVCYANYSDGSRTMAKRHDNNPTSSRWQVEGPGINVSFSQILDYLNLMDTIYL